MVPELPRYQATHPRTFHFAVSIVLIIGPSGESLLRPLTSTGVPRQVPARPRPAGPEVAGGSRANQTGTLKSGHARRGARAATRFNQRGCLVTGRGLGFRV